MLLESQLLGRFFLDRDERFISLFSADAAERSGQPTGVNWFIRGAAWPKLFLLRRLFQCGERDRVVDVFSGRVGVTGIYTADTMPDPAVPTAMRSTIMERAQLINISPSPRVS